MCTLLNQNEHTNDLESSVPQKGTNHFKFSFVTKMQDRSVTIVTSYGLDI